MRLSSAENTASTDRRSQSFHVSYCFEKWPLTFLTWLYVFYSTSCEFPEEVLRWTVHAKNSIGLYQYPGSHSAALFTFCKKDVISIVLKLYLISRYHLLCFTNLQGAPPPDEAVHELFSVSWFSDVFCRQSAAPRLASFPEQNNASWEG